MRHFVFEPLFVSFGFFCSCSTLWSRLFASLSPPFFSFFVIGKQAFGDVCV